ncbi:DUF4309 domain-containing protein [Gottfriedia sp. OAE603]|uniref:DUF4309 domain-containing protein n=1 Tax=Gottfriedia sp. OAE603 TaxID=2663872 RepID=UPI00178C0AC4
MRNFTSKNKILFATIMSALVLLAALSPIFIPKIKHLIAVSQIEPTQKRLLDQITNDAGKGKMINSPFKIGDSYSSVKKQWGAADTDPSDNGNTPFLMDLLVNGMYPEDMRSFIYEKKAVKFEVNSMRKINSMTTVDKRLNKLSKSILTKYYGKPEHEYSDYSLYKVGEYQLMFQFLHDGEFYNTNRYIIIPKDSTKQINTLKKIAKLAKQGKVLNFTYPVGTPVKEITQKLGEPNQIDSGGSNLIYKDVSLDVDQKNQLIKGMLVTDPNLKKISYITLKNTLGKPFKEENDESRFLTYKFGNYKIHFYFGGDVPGNPDLGFYSLD